MPYKWCRSIFFIYFFLIPCRRCDTFPYQRSILMRKLEIKTADKKSSILDGQVIPFIDPVYHVRLWRNDECSRAVTRDRAHDLHAFDTRTFNCFFHKPVQKKYSSYHSRSLNRAEYEFARPHLFLYLFTEARIVQSYITFAITVDTELKWMWPVAKYDITPRAKVLTLPFLP